MQSTPRFQARTVKPLPAWGTSENPPKEFRLFTFGETMNATWMGGRRESFTLTPQGAQAIIAEWSRRNIEGTFDRDHDFGDSRGTFDVEMRRDGLWISSIVWTAETLQKFKEKKLRHYSPTFDVEYSDKGEPIRDKEGRLQICTLINIALTNYPATDNLRPLIALSMNGGRRRYLTMDLTKAQELAAKIVEAVEGKAELIDKAVILLMADEQHAPMEEMPAEMGAPMEEEMQQVLQAAYTATGMKGRACVGALQQLSTIRAAHDKAVAELRTIKHTAAVDLAIKEKKLTPAKRAEALAMDPEIFRGWTSLASPVVDDTTLTPKSNHEAMKKPLTVDEVINDDMRAFCLSSNTDVNAFAQTWVTKYPGIPFKK